MLVMHIRFLGEDTLARKVYSEQYAMGWPGLARKTVTICEELKIADCNTTKLSKKITEVL